MGRKKTGAKEAGALLEEPAVASELPKRYKVILLNDDYTPMDFVILILEQVFGMDNQRATQIMLQVHNAGKAVCGVFTYEIAETKATQVIEYARASEYPLQCVVEPIS
ncbi:MAG: ATP-dependent Clp protease adaptor protein ClpS [Gammaproteobacteria bacterium]|jgi:ATP-dependent Clp protease adaptor protein ClpS|nr:ATP-dependent Clp protease adaptor protein ClpS [Gammaproteobacteria bacterium]